MFPARWVTAAVATWCCVVAASCRGGAAAENVTLGLAAPYVFEEGQRCDVDTTCLIFNFTENLLGVDSLGTYVGNRTHYRTLSGANVVFSTRNYSDGVQVFRQDFPDGLKGTSTGNKDAVSTSFPRFILPGPSEAPDLRYATPGGNMVGWVLYSQGSVATDLDSFRDGEDGGIVILFNGEVGNVSSVVISSLTNPMAINVMLNRDALTLEWGVQGQAENIPSGYSAEVILYPGSQGIGRNILAWGEALRTYHSTQKEEDPSAEVVSYYTDNGAAHYYNPLPYSNYHEAMMSVYNYSVTYDVPIRRLQLDSWFYHKGVGDGVKNWTEIEELLPEGIAGLHEATGWPTVAHNRWFSSDTDYATQNGGPYLFTVDEENQKALPLERVFWDDLFETTVPWGLVVYEQDWLDQQYMHISALHTNLTLGTTWLNDMGEAARERGLNIQYCMTLVRHVLHSVTLSPVTQVRVSADYLADPEQWRIGVTSLLAHALALRPFKDVFWTSHVNVNSVYVDCELVLPDLEHPRQATQGQGDKKCRVQARTEENPTLQSAVSTLSAGPLGVGDLAENLNIQLIRKSCSSDGRLLHASKPLTVVDGYFFSSDYREVWTAYSDVSSTHFGIIFLAEVGNQLTVTPEDLNLENAFVNQTLVFSNYPGDLNYSSTVSSQETLDLPYCGGYLNFCLLYTTPRIQTEGGDLYILGELDKWVPVSPNRITDISIIPSNSTSSIASTVLLTVRGVQSEAVTLSFTGAVDFTITCDFLQDGVMTADTQTQRCDP